MDPSAAAGKVIKNLKLVQVTITILGIVQGVGMRPFAARLADRLGIAGSVRNAGAHLVIEASGSQRQLDDFLAGLRNELPPAARIIRITIADSDDDTDSVNDFGTVAGPAAEPASGFRIAASQPAAGLVMISPDLGICPDCRRELEDPADRRHNHALISCMHCGPRYSILEELPYDRQRTTLRDFPLCPACHQEFTTRQDRRYHAQTVSCPDCGPQLSLHTGAGLAAAGGAAALARAMRILEAGGILAVKGLGGYHLSCRADLGETVARLRQIKAREEKPFAVLFADLDAIRQAAGLNAAESAQLASPACPIVLVHPRPADPPYRIHPLVSGGSRLLGAFLPATPIQLQLARQLGPLVMTSANLSGDVICIDDAEMLAFADTAGLDGVLSHDRRIVSSLDDSVLRLAAGQPLLIRRARGFVPLPVDLAATEDRRGTAPEGNRLRIAAAGGDLKATPALTRDALCYLGAPVGDLSDQAVNAAWQRQVRHLGCLLQLEPDWLVADKHPDYLSGRLLRDLFPDRPLLAVQHHQAHIAAVLAENPGYETALGVAMDGTGYGDDGTVWGGEWLICRGKDMTRAACLRPIPFSGGDRGRQRAWQCLVSHLVAGGAAGEALLATIPCLQSRAEDTAIVAAACRHGVGTIPSSSTGSLFDAVCALLGFGDINHYEGQCAQSVEQAAAEAETLGLSAPSLPELFRLTRTEDGLIIVDPAPLFAGLYGSLAAGADPRSLALAFHTELAAQIGAVCRTICRASAITAVALGGGCFQNVLLLEKTVDLLRQAGLTVLTNRQVPPGDGGLALGQTWIASRMIAAMAGSQPQVTGEV